MQDSAVVTLPKVVATSGTVAASGVVESACAKLGTACSIVGYVPDILLVLGAMVTLDMLTGIFASRAEGQVVRSNKMREGVFKKFTMLLVIAGAVLLETVFKEHGFNLDGLLFRWTTSWFIVIEALSLYENAARMGIPMPAFLKRAMQWLIQKGESTVDGALPGGPVAPSAPPAAQSRIDTLDDGDESPRPPRDSN